MWALALYDESEGLMGDQGLTPELMQVLRKECTKKKWGAWANASACFLALPNFAFMFPRTELDGWQTVYLWVFLAFLLFTGIGFMQSADRWRDLPNELEERCAS